MDKAPSPLRGPPLLSPLVLVTILPSLVWRDLDHAAICANAARYYMVLLVIQYNIW